MTPLDLDQIRKRRSGAVLALGGIIPINRSARPCDVIESSLNDLAALLAEVTRLHAQVDALSAAREMMALLVPVGEATGTVEQNIAEHIARLRTALESGPLEERTRIADAKLLEAVSCKVGSVLTQEQQLAMFLASNPTPPMPTAEQIARWPRGMDAACIPLCEALSTIPGIVTTYSCDGEREGLFHVGILVETFRLYKQILSMLNCRAYGVALPGPHAHQGQGPFKWRVEAMDSGLEADFFRLDLTACPDWRFGPWMAADLIKEISWQQGQGNLPSFDTDEERAENLAKSIRS